VQGFRAHQEEGPDALASLSDPDKVEPRKRDAVATTAATKRVERRSASALPGNGGHLHDDLTRRPALDTDSAASGQHGDAETFLITPEG
jgi:hypothetical protein